MKKQVINTIIGLAIFSNLMVNAQKIPQKVSKNKHWQLVWSDEFNYTGLPDSTKWTYDVGYSFNNEKQYYKEKSLANSSVKEGKLTITALKDDSLKYTSARLITYGKKSIQYGKVEVMAKLPRGKGNWPAIWMLPESRDNKTESWPLCGEIDIMEHVGKDENMIHVSLHSALYNHIKNTQITHFERLTDVVNTFHKYGIEWTKKGIKFFIDDKLFYQAIKGQDNHVKTNEGWPFDKPYYLILNLAIGGDWGGEIDETIFPQKLEIDYVRFFQKK